MADPSNAIFLTPSPHSINSQGKNHQAQTSAPNGPQARSWVYLLNSHNMANLGFPSANFYPTFPAMLMISALFDPCIPTIQTMGLRCFL
jgi:hypothetical protein